MKNRFSRTLLILLILVAVPFWWLLIYADRSVASPKPIHIAELRKLAAIMPGPHPTAITYAVLATRQSLGDYWAAGIGLKRRPVAIVAWALPVPGMGPIMIDPGAPLAGATMSEFADFDRLTQNRIDTEARHAGLVLYTQRPASKQPHPLPTGGQPDASATAVAPGVVVIPASSMAPGARMIFVQLADGREFLFAGAIATFTENWTMLRARSRLAADWEPPQDRAETYAWLRTIRQLRIEAPKLRIVPDHDAVWLARQQANGTIAAWQPRSLPAPKTGQAR